MKERLTLKHDIAANWKKAVNFVPLAGEIIIYDGIVEDGKYIEIPKLKIGDGKTKLNDLPFVESDATKTSEINYTYYDDTLELF